MAIELPDGEVVRNIPEQVAYLSEKIVELQQEKVKESKEFVDFWFNDANCIIDFKKKTTLAVTNRNKIKTKNVNVKCWGTKLGNRIYNDHTYEGEVNLRKILKDILGYNFTYVDPNDETITTPGWLFPKEWKWSGDLRYVYKTEVSIYEDCYPDKLKGDLIANRLDTSNYESGTTVTAYARFMIKFISDFEIVPLSEETHKWKGNMARNWLEIQICYAYNDDYDPDNAYVYVLPIKRRFS